MVQKCTDACCLFGTTKEATSIIGCSQDPVPDSACLPFLSRFSYERKIPTGFVDTLCSSHLMFLDIDALLGPTRIAPVDKDRRFVGAM